MLTRTSTTLLNSLLEDPPNDHAWRIFCDRYSPAIFRFAHRHGQSEADAEEVLSETLSTFFQGYRTGRYDRQRGRLRAWVFGIAMMKVHEARRRLANAGRLESLEYEPHELTTESCDPEFDEDIERTLAWECLEAVRTQVAPLTYQAFDLYVLKERPAEEVARILGIKRDAVYVAKSRVLSRARREYDKLRAQDEEV